MSKYFLCFLTHAMREQEREREGGTGKRGKKKEGEKRGRAQEGERQG